MLFHFIVGEYIRALKRNTDVNKCMEFWRSIKLLYVLAAVCHHLGDIQNNGLKAQHVNLGIMLPLLKLTCGHARMGHTGG
jgi:Na+-transporting NADH:ubiquinone oxidoreductase subunit NqrE